MMQEHELAALRADVVGLNWIFAKTMPHIPHWYIVRSPVNEAVYVRLFEAWREHATPGTFQGSKYKYLHLRDGFKYWAMTNDVRASKILNRDVVSD
jgi:hypothetical protein